MKSLLILIACLTSVQLVFSQSNIQQSTSINSDGAVPAASAMLDVQATDKGMLVPRMTSAQRTAIASPATGLLVFETVPPPAPGGSFWFFNGVSWVSLNSGNAVWSLTGNNTSVNDFLGTTNNQPLVFKVNSLPAGKITFTGNNTFFGLNAGQANTTGFSNIAIGKDALYANDTGNENTATGSFALTTNTTGSYNTATGSNALLNNSTGFNNTANGRNALASNTIGYYNTANGENSLFFNLSGTENTASGVGALYKNTSGSFNTANGVSALFNNTIGLGNTASGLYALFENIDGDYNTATGIEALRYNTYGEYNTAMGASALYSNISSNENTATGAAALYSNVDGDCNTANGYQSLFLNISGTNNTANGASALYSNASGNYNTANGSIALYSNTYGAENTATGVGALYSNTTGDKNTAIGIYALCYNLGGSYNTAMGRGSLGGINATDNSYATSIGYLSGPGGNYINSISIGHDCHSDGTDRAQIGRTSMALIGGYQPWTNYASDGRFKRQVRENVGGLDFILHLRPVTYTVDYHALESFKGIESFEARAAHPGREVSAKELAGLRQMQADKEASLAIAEAKIQSGFIAQEVLQAAEAIGYDFDGVNKPQHEKDNYSLAYSQFVVPLVKGMQEQQAFIEELRAENTALKTHDEQQKMQIEAQAAQLQKITTALQGAGISVEK